MVDSRRSRKAIAEKSISFLLTGVMVLSLNAQQASLKGIEAGDIDRSVQPCADFYDFANGAWRAKNPIPASMDRWSRRWQAGEINKDQLRTILDEVSSGTQQMKGSPAQVAGDFYAACTNVETVDDAGITPLKPLLAGIAAIQNGDDLQQEIGKLQGIGINVPFAFGGMPDQHDPTRVIAEVGAAGLGLPDRDYYLKPEKRFGEARSAYVAYIAQLLTLSGIPDTEAKTSAESIMKLETSLAKASLDNVALRDPHATDHVVSFDALKKMAPRFDWSAYFKGADVPEGPVNVDQPEFLKEVEHQLTFTSLARWKAYLRWQLLNSEASSLSQPFVDAHFAFYQTQLAGVHQLKPRATRCAEQTDALLGEASGQEYVKRHFPPEAKERAEAMVTNIIAAMRETLQDVDWMTPATKKRALEKLDSLRVKVGYPDKWKDYSSLQITREDYLGDVLAASRFVVEDQRSTIGRPVDHGRWDFTPPTSNASYNPVLNEITFPAGILQPPAFSVNATDGVNYGAIGVVIGHEISHGFDDQGAQFDAQGKLNNWWSPDDLVKFQTKTACVARQFDAFTIDGPADVHAQEIHINGKLVLGRIDRRPGGIEERLPGVQEDAAGQVRCEDRRLHARPAIFSLLGAVPRRRDAAGDAEADGPGRSASSGEISCARADAELSAVCGGLQL